MNIRNSFARLRSLTGAIDEFFKEFIDELPEFFDNLAAGYRTRENTDDYSRIQRLLKGFMTKDKILFGKKSVYRVHSIWSLADFYRKHYRYGEAETLYRQGVKLLLDSIKEENKLPFQFRERLGEFIEFLDQYSKTPEAEYLQRELIDKTQDEGNIKQKALDRVRLAQLCARNGKGKEAAAYLKEGRDLLEPILGAASNELLAFLEEQKFVFGRADLPPAFLDDCRKHISLLDQVLIMERALGQDHQSIIPALDALISYYSSQNKMELAKKLKVDRDIAFLAAKTKGSYFAVVRDLQELASLYETRNEGADATMAFHARAKAKRIVESKKIRKH